jgi:hypothetical protein
LSDEPRTEDGWPPELTFLLARHPRPSWPVHASPSVAFWLQVHDHLRRDAAGLETTADDYRAARLSTSQLAVVAAPRLRGLIASLHGHHQIEDFHYFPVFRRTEPRLAAGFDRLAADHVEIARDVSAALAALAELRAAAERAVELRHASLAAQRCIAASSELCRHLCRHLADEEALVVPLLIEHGDD